MLRSRRRSPRIGIVSDLPLWDVYAVSYWELFSVVAPVLALVLAGVGVRHLRWLTKEADESLLRLTVKFLYPILIFQTCASNPAAADLRSLAWAPALGFVTIVLGFLIAALVVRWMPGVSKPKARTFIFTVGIFNYGYIPVPIVSHFFPEVLGTLFVFNLGVDVAIWTLGIAILSGAEGRIAWSRLVNPSIVAVFLGLAFNLLGLWTHVPAAVVTTLALLAPCTVPVALMMIGATLIDEVRSGNWADDWHLGAVACVLRTALIPLVFLGIAAVLPIGDALQRVLVIQAAMPAAILPIVLARHYKGDPRTAIWVVVATTALGLFTIPAWMGAGLSWLGLH